jgi:hypothetical protein
MTYRHKAVKSALDVGKSAEWNDDHIEDFTLTKTETDCFLSSAVAANWDTSETSGGGVAPVIALVDSHTSAEMDTGATNAAISSMQKMGGGIAGNITSYEDAPVLTLAITLDTYPNDTECIEFGLMDSGTSPFTANASGAYFRISSDVLYAVTGTGAAETATDITPTLGIGAHAVYRIELGSSNAKFYIDNMVTAVRTETATLPTGELTAKISCTNVGGAGKDVVMYVDAASLSVNRYQG